MATRESELIRTARAVARLQRQIAAYRKAIKKTQGELAHERKVLRALAYAAENGNPVQSVPSRLTGGVTGYKVPAKVERAVEPVPVEDLTLGFEDIATKVSA